MRYPVYNKKTSSVEKKLTVLMWVVVISIIAFFIGLNIYILIAYGGKPVDEIPSWVLWFWFGGNNNG
jgi:hypothetical protein